MGSNRTFSGQATYYYPGLGACGEVSKDSDIIAALDKAQWGHPSNPSDSPYCGQKAKVTHDDKSVTVKIVDMCPGCAYGDLDLSPAAFDKIANQAEGRVDITWEFLQVSNGASAASNCPPFYAHSFPFTLIVYGLACLWTLIL